MYDPNDPNFAYYLNNNQNLMNSGQDALREAARTAQQNFHQQMGTVLQGTMAASMALYGAGKTVGQKAQEVVYNDMLLNNSGSYVLQRSAMREMLWGFGIAGSEMGRTLQIGGRRPEFVTPQEYQFQMQRAVHHRQSELIDMAISAGGSLGASALTSALTSSTALGAMGATGLVAGLAVPIGIGLGLQQLTKPIIQPMLDRRAAVREMAEFTEMADLNRGTGQRRMSEESSRELALRFHEQDVSKTRYIPIVGGMIAGRLENTEKQKEIFKKMASMDMLRDINVEDVDAIQKRVQKTADIMDKFAGMMNTTRDTILKIKGQFNAMGFNDTQQNAALESVARFTYSTGFSKDAALQLHGAFTQMGFQSGNFRMGQENLQAAYGLNEVASIEALRQGGMISRMYNPGTLGQQFYQNAVNLGQTGWGRVTERGGGNVASAADYYRRQGAGSTVLGMELENLSMFGKTTNPLDEYERNSDITRRKLRQGGMSEADTLAYMLSRETTKEGKEQAWLAYSGLRTIGAGQAEASRRLTALGRIEESSKIVGAYSLNQIATLSPALKIESTLSESARVGRILQSRERMLTSDAIGKESVGLYDKYKDFSKNFENQVHDIYISEATGLDPNRVKGGIREPIYEQMYQAGYIEKKGGKLDTATADRMINQKAREMDKSETLFKGKLSQLSARDTKSDYAFLMDYENAQHRLGSFGAWGNNDRFFGDKAIYDYAASKLRSNPKLLREVVEHMKSNGHQLDYKYAKSSGLVKPNPEGEYAERNNFRQIERAVRDEFNNQMGVDAEGRKTERNVESAFNTVMSSGAQDEGLKNALHDLGIDKGGIGRYKEVIRTMVGQDFKSLTSGSFNWKKDKGRLVEELGVYFGDTKTSKKFVETLKGLTPEKRAPLLAELAEHPLKTFTPDEKKHFQAMAEGKSSQDETMQKFTNVLDRLAKALEAK
jgi:hypothetical protein